MRLRVCFENMEAVNVNDGSMIRHYAQSYLADFPTEWAGFIMIPHGDTKRSTMEPVWQVIIRDATPEAERNLLAYLKRNPMAGYYVHVYRVGVGNEFKIH